MKIVDYIILAVLTLLALSSGATKIMLVEREVEFFGEYGFTAPILIAYGVIQLVGGILLIFPQSRTVGALVVSATFVISLAVLVLAGNIPLANVTVICVALLVIVIRRSGDAKDRVVATDRE